MGLCAALMGCGGGEDSSSNNPPTNNPPTTNPPTISYTAGVYPASSTFADQCQAPRSGTDPKGKAFPDKAGSALAEKHFLRSWTNELYLWFDEVADRDPASVADVKAYFDLLRTTALTPSGKDKDYYHFTADTAAYYQQSQSGISEGYGISWAVVNREPPRRVVVEYVQSGSQAATLGIGRGAELTSIDGIDVVNVNTRSGVEAINSAVFAPASGSTHQFGIKDRGSSTSHNVALAAAPVIFNPTPTVKVLATGTGNLGYLLFNDHTVSAEAELIKAINTLKAGNVQDLVLDLRYNGGGYLAIASELAYMIAGSARTSGKTFEREQFNSKYPNINPVTGASLNPLPFASSTVYASSSSALPSLNLGRVYVLTSGLTCSASESIINSLRGIGVDVYQIGANTCGKPYGFYARDNCGTTYFSIQFKGVNAMGFGDYADGFSATRAGGEPQAKLPGCYAADDYAHDLGDTSEEQLRVAMEYRNSGNMLCTNTLPLLEAVPASSEPGIALKPPAEPWRNNRLLSR
jgi:C-terminal processing protease CtpA/Prc